MTQQLRNCKKKTGLPRGAANFLSDGISAHGVAKGAAIVHSTQLNHLPKYKFPAEKLISTYKLTTFVKYKVTFRAEMEKPHAINL